MSPNWRQPDGARVLEVGCGPGRLSIRLARQHSLEVTGLDLDPAMIERAQANTDREGDGDEQEPSFLVGDVASLGVPRRIVRPGREHVVDSALGQPRGRPGRDRLRAAARRPGTRVGEGFNNPNHAAQRYS